MNEAQRSPEHEVPADDAVIGRAFRASLLVIGLGATVGVGAWWLFSDEDEATEATEIEVTAPRTVERVATVPSVHFTDITDEAGIDFERVNGATGEKFLPETMGGGVAFLDYDVDGDADLLFVNGSPWDPESDGAPHALYANDGTGHFVDVTEEVGLGFRLRGMGVASGDWDADGDPDLYLSGVGEHRLLRNDQGRFVDVTEVLGAPHDPERWGTSAAFFDADCDGDLDLFVCSYVRWSPEVDKDVDYRLTGVGRAYGPPMNYAGDHSRLYRNLGDGRFAEVGAQVGIQVTNPATDVPVGKALGVVPVDVDGDGWMDLAVANDTIGNFLFKNKGDGTFEEVGSISGMAFDRNGRATGAMGIDAVEYRNDGELGLAIANFANEMTCLYVSRPGVARFTDESIVDGIGGPSLRFLSFGVLFFDYDLDGRPDLLQVNGHLENEINKVQPSQTYAQTAQLFWNAGASARRTFLEVEEAGDLLARPIVGRGCSYADIDADGDLDVVLTQSRGRPTVLRNDADFGHHWLRVRLVGERSNREGVGASVILRAGGVRQVRRVTAARGYLSQVEPVAHFGLAEAGQIESLTVVWPCGTEQVVEPPAVDQVLVVREER